jgi:hypothetical protein
MVKYVGPKKIMNVPFPENNEFPLKSFSDLHEVIQFPRNTPIELSPERAEALLNQSPGNFKVWATIKPAVTIKKKVEQPHGQGDQGPVQEATESADDHV